MRSHIPKLLHPICGRPMIGWPLRPRRMPAPTGWWWSTARVASSSRCSTAASSSPSSSGRSGPPTRSRRPRTQIARASTVIVLNGDTPLVTGATRSQQLADGTRAIGRRGDDRHVVLDDPSGYGRVVRGPDGTVEKVVETKRAGRRHRARAPHPRGQHRDLRVRRPRAAGGARARLERQRPGRALPARRAPDHARARAHRRRLRADRRERDDRRSTTASRSRTPARSRSGRSVSGTCSPGSTIVDPASTVIDVEVEIGQDAVIEPFSSLRGVTTDRRGDPRSVR